MNQNQDKNYTIHVISNTHWDRDWVYPFQETRLLLLEFMDDLLDLLERDKKFHSFLIDSAHFFKLVNAPRPGYTLISPSSSSIRRS